MKVIGKDRTSCDMCNPIDEIIARLDALERRTSAIVAKVQGIAPDGEGNVTLPTSSSDTDPLHGRVDTFAMSSEVKEAADDAHAYAASIADDVVVINSEIDALNQAVAALQPAEIEAIKTAVETLQTTVATLESAVATLNDGVVNKVSKSGDTMTGNLFINTPNPNINLINTAHNITTIPSSTIFSDIQFFDSTITRVALLEHYRNENNRKQLALILNSSETTGTETWAFMGLANDGYGTYGFAPSWSVGTNDNSDKILTIKMANSLPSLVHTTGNETIAGFKEFLNSITLKSDGTKRINFSNGSGTDQGYLSMSDGNIWFKCNGGNITLEAPNGTTNAPTTPSSATGTEIATANWVIAKINELATKNGLNGM